MSKEASFWNWLRGHIGSLGHFTRIESEISAGVPDVYFVLKNTVGRNDGWIELKSLKAPKRDSSRPLKRRGLRDDQVEWIDKHCAEGVQVFIFVKLDSNVYIFRGSRARYLNQMTFGEIKTFSNFTIPLRRPKKWTRFEFQKALTSYPSENPYSSPSKVTTSVRTARMIPKSPSTSRR